MKVVLCAVLLWVAVPVWAEPVFFRIVEIESLQLVTDTDRFQLGERCTIKNQKGRKMSLSEIQLPARARGEFEWKGELKELQWVLLTGAENNRTVPE
jgi:hypothetical protein